MLCKSVVGTPKCVLGKNTVLLKIMFDFILIKTILVISRQILLHRSGLAEPSPNDQDFPAWCIYLGILVLYFYITRCSIFVRKLLEFDLISEQTELCVINNKNNSSK